MQEELSRARRELAGSESVESVIRLLDETFERLQTEVVAADEVVDGSASMTTTTTTSTEALTSAKSSSTFSSYSSMQQVDRLLYNVLSVLDLTMN
jgi:hypothetical protein